jgi:hypothetical protein
MGIGLSVLLIAAGAILAFAVDVNVSGVDLEVVGWILMGAGALGLIWSLVLLNSRRREVVVEPRHSAAHVVADTAPVTEVEVRHEPTAAPPDRPLA